MLRALERDEVLVFTHGCRPTWLRKVRYWQEHEYRNGYDAHSPRAWTPDPEPPPPPAEPEQLELEAVALTSEDAELVDDFEDVLVQMPEQVRDAVLRRMQQDRGG